ncbi:MAG: hypothetical protein AB7I38_11170 [Dehalococcoidia bacterium]
MSGRGDGCPKCGGRLLRDLEIGGEYFGTVEVRKCINCGFVPGAQRAPSEEESGAAQDGRYRERHPRPLIRPWGPKEIAAWEREQRAPAEAQTR